jgi:hypothetical protein
LTSYLVVPRPGDAVKIVILPAAFVITAATGGTVSVDATGRALLVWAVLELLVYPARYQVNDILGFEADQQHPGGDRGRLPGPLAAKRARVTTSGAVATLKVVAGLVVAAFAPQDMGRIILLVMAAVLVTAVAYELLRAFATGHTGEVPAPVTPGVVAIWLVIGAGYAVRGLTGVALAVDLASSNGLAVAALVAWWAFGVGWVTSRWAVEATAYARPGTGGLTWRARPEDAREHLLALVRWFPDGPTGDPDPESALGRWRPTEAGTRLTAPWHLAGIAAGGFAALSGWLLVDPAATRPAQLVALAAGAATAAVVARSGAVRAFSAILAVMALMLLGLAFDLSVTWVLPWASVTAAQIVYLRQDRESMGAVGERIKRAVSASNP